jgi:hypothetical protein
MALHALRLDAQKKLLEELADGGVTSLPTAQAKARELMGTAGGLPGHVVLPSFP